MDEVVHQEEETFPNHVAAMEAQTGDAFPAGLTAAMVGDGDPVLKSGSAATPEPAISPAPDIPADIDDAMTEHEASRLPRGC